MYKRLFFSYKTVTAALIGVFLCFAAMITAEVISGTLQPFEIFDIITKTVLCVFLFLGSRKHMLLSMQAGACGLLVALTYYQAAYVFTDLLGRTVESFVDLGFWGSFYLAGELLLLVYNVILTLNHYFLFVMEKTNLMRVSISQAMIRILFAIIILQLFVISRFSSGPLQIFLCASRDLSVLFQYMLIACAQLILALDREEGGLANEI